MSKHSTIGFSYKVEGITLQTTDDNLRTTNIFITRDIIDEINLKLKAQNFKVDESSLRTKYLDDQLFVEGFAVEIQEYKAVGFMSSR